MNKEILSEERKYSDFEKMKIFCQNNNYIFLIFDIKNSEFYYYNNNKLKKTDLKNDDYQFNIKNIFIKAKYIKETKKLNYFFDIDNPNIIGEIKLPLSFDEEKINKDFNFTFIENKAIFKRDIDKNDINIEPNNINEVDIKYEKEEKNKENEIIKKKKKQEYLLDNNSDEDVAKIFKKRNRNKTEKKESPENTKRQKK